MRKKTRNKKTLLFLSGAIIFIIGCSNQKPVPLNPYPQYQQSAPVSNETSMSKINEAYNRKNGTEGRNIVLDTLIATTFYNHPNLIPSFSKSKTHSKTKINTSSVSNTVSNSETFSTPSGFSGTQTNSVTTTKTKTKSTTKSITGGVNVAPNLDFYLK